MMKKWLFLVFLLIGLVACSQEEAPDEQQVEVHPLEVSLQVPTNGEVGEEIKIVAEVTYGEEKVVDADEVLFEVWKEGEKEESKKEHGQHTTNGVYELTYQFNEEGIYFVQSHVTAKGQHNMPKKQIVIGNPKEQTEEGQKQHSDGEQSHSHHVQIDFIVSESINAHEETMLTTVVKKGHEFMTGAKVRYEIWKANSHQHIWVDTTEQSNGSYTASYSFMDSGEYHVKIHVSNDEGLHEHIEKAVKVQ